jgi:hypothetical protein
MLSSLLKSHFQVVLDKVLAAVRDQMRPSVLQVRSPG